MDLVEILNKIAELQKSSKEIEKEVKAYSEAFSTYCERIKYVAENAMKILLRLQRQWKEALQLQEELGKRLTPKEIKDLRRKLGLSQKAFAKQLGVSLRTVQRWERGESKPSKMALFHLALLLKEVENQ